MNIDVKSVFTSLTVIKFLGYLNGRRYWECACVCGKIVKVRQDHLVSGKTLSCGCYRKFKSPRYQGTHSLTGTRFFRIWTGIKERCYNKNCPSYPQYGARGITLHTSWINCVEKFVEYVQELPGSMDASLTLDRIDNDGNYEPKNLRWATKSQQASNQQRSLTSSQIEGIQDSLQNSCLSNGKIATLFNVSAKTVSAFRQRTKKCLGNV